MLPLQTSIPPVPRDVAGEVVVPIALLRRKLGRPAFHVWQILITRRDARGYTHTTRAGMTRARAFESLSERAIKSALVRLRSARLVIDLGWRPLKIKNGAEVEAYWRQVRGARVIPDGPTQRALVPHDAAAWLAQASSHGGARLGAGRPREPVLRLVEGGAGCSEAHQTKSSRAEGGGSDGIQEGPPSSLWLVSTPKVASLSLRSREASQGRVASHDPSQPTALDGCRMTWTGDDEQRIFRPARFERPAPTWVHNEVVPPWPTLERVPRARVPRPPLLDAGLGPQRRRAILARWYKCAIESRFGKHKQANAAMAYNGSRKVAALLDDAARAFIEHEIPPAAWCAWICDVHLRTCDEDERNKPPMIWIVFARSVIEKRAGWFSHEADTIGGRVIATPSAQRLSDLYHLSLIHI